MQTLDFVLGLHNCLESPNNLSLWCNIFKMAAKVKKFLRLYSLFFNRYSSFLGSLYTVIYQFQTFYAHLILLFAVTSRRCPAILWLSCDYNSNTSSNISHSSSRGYICPWKHAGFNAEKVLKNVGCVGARSGSKAPPCVPTISWLNIWEQAPGAKRSLMCTETCKMSLEHAPGDWNKQNWYFFFTEKI